MNLFKKATGAALALAISVSAFTGISASGADNGSLVVAGGWYETAYAEWSNETNEANAKVEYKSVDETSYTVVDEELVRSLDNGNGRVDIPGLAAGNYNIRITTGSGEVLESVVKVTAYDRSGYAHFNNSGVGAYNDDNTC